MNTKIRKIINIQVMPESARMRIRRKVYEAFMAGEKKSSAASRLHLHDNTVGRLYNRFESEGEAAISGKKRGPKAGTAKHKLSDEQLKILKKTVTDKTPDQLKFDFALWSSLAIKEFVQTKFGCEISRRTARRHMRKMGFTYQCPVLHAREQQPAAVSKWLDETYPEIKKEATKYGASILWADESSVLCADTSSRGYSPRGVAPILRNPANRSIRCNMISAIGNKGDMQFMFFDGAMNAAVFTDFMERLIRDAGRRVFLIVDNLRVHHATCLAPWLKEHEDEIRLFFLPSDSPELNPDEYLNRDVKSALSEQSRPMSKNALRSRVETHLRKRQEDPEAVKRLFEKPEVQYAADK